MQANLATFINSRHPVYEGVNPQDGEFMKVALTSWKADIRLGTGEIRPYVIPSNYKNSPLHVACFDYKDDIIKFCQDDYWKTPIMTFTLSEDFKSLTLIDKISEKALSVLNLVD